MIFWCKNKYPINSMSKTWCLIRKCVGLYTNKVTCDELFLLYDGIEKSILELDLHCAICHTINNEIDCVYRLWISCSCSNLIIEDTHLCTYIQRNEIIIHYLMNLLKSKAWINRQEIFWYFSGYNEK